MALRVCCLKACCVGTHTKQSVSKGLGTSGPVCFVLLVVLLLCREKHVLWLYFPSPSSTSWYWQP